MVLEVILVVAALAIVGFWVYNRYIKDNDKVQKAIKDVANDIQNTTKDVVKDVKNTTKDAAKDVKDTAKDVEKKL